MGEGLAVQKGAPADGFGDPDKHVQTNESASQ